MEWLAVRLCRLVCLLWGEDPGWEVPLFSSHRIAGEGLDTRSSPSPVDYPRL